MLAALGTLAPWQPSELLTWCANTGNAETDRVVNQDDPADIDLDVSPWFDRKLAAANAHVSQHAMFLRNNKTDDLANALRRQEAFRRWPHGGLPVRRGRGAPGWPRGRQVALTSVPAGDASPSWRDAGRAVPFSANGERPSSHDDPIARIMTSGSPRCRV